MKLSHLRATLWLRWRILRNRVKRGGKLSNVLLVVLVFVGACVSLGAFALALFLGLESLPEAEPVGLMVAWGALALAFVFFWTIGLLTDLQRSDAMSFKNLLHLPVSLGWVFLYNYLSSFVSLSIAIFLPAMLGLWLAMVIVFGPSMLLGLPLLLGFFVMVTGLTYQLRGWLARLMEDKRRGRNIVAAITVGFVLLVQLPNLINLSVDRSGGREARHELTELRQLAHDEGPEQAAAEAELARIDAERIAGEQELEHNITMGTMLVPPGWLPYGMRATFEGRWLRGSLCALGMLAVGVWSLRRSYRTTMLSVVGGGGRAVVRVSEPTERDDERRHGSAAVERKAVERKAVERKAVMVERRLPFAGEAAAGIALASLRGLLRAPEVKLLLLSPVILLGLFGVILSRGSTRESLAPFASSLSLAAIAMGLLSVVQLLQNQFGLDRAGFRAYLLSPVPRKEILLGKNLATAPIGICVGVVALLVLQLLVPTDFSHFVGGVLQLFSAYLLLCLLGNQLSILSPMRLKENGLKAANAKFVTVVLQILSLVLIPITLLPLMVPSVVEFFLRWQDWARNVPVFLLLQAVGVVGVALFYRMLLRWQGALLQEREQHILDVLTRD